MQKQKWVSPEEVQWAEVLEKVNIKPQHTDYIIYDQIFI